MIDNKLIVHVSEVNVTKESGMGRVEWYWKQAFERAGFEFVHIGPAETGTYRHPALFPRKAFHYYKGLKVKPAALIVHEPAAGVFTSEKIPCFVESHGVERRYWNATLRGEVPGEPLPSLKTRLFFPLWRLRGCDKGLTRASRLLLINSDDASFVQQQYGRKRDDIYLFRNGINTARSTVDKPHDSFTVLFNGSWIARKGIQVLIDAAEILHSKKIDIRYLLIGTGSTEQIVKTSWSSTLTDAVKVIPQFAAADEPELLTQADIFVLPSFFEGQPLSLLQAMNASKCCITTNCCGQKDLIEHGKNGLLFTPGDAVQLAALVEYCYNNRNKMRAIGQNAADSVKNRDWQQVAEETINYIIQELKSL